MADYYLLRDGRNYVLKQDGGVWYDSNLELVCASLIVRFTALEDEVLIDEKLFDEEPATINRMLDFLYGKGIVDKYRTEGLF